MSEYDQETTGHKPSVLENQLREMYGRLAYTHKTHEKMADSYVKRYRRIKFWEITLSAVTSGSLLLAVFGDSKCGTVVGAGLSTILLGLVLFVKEGNLGEQAQRHSETAAKLWGLREKLLSLLVDLRSGHAEDNIRQTRDEVNASLENIYKVAPRTNGDAYAEAQKALKTQEELFFSDSELDHLLPSALRVSPNKSTDDFKEAP